jgi:hypothetical protein
MDECESPKLKLKLHIIYKEGQSRSQIVSDCLSLNDIGKIHETIAKDCNTRQVEYRTRR